MARLNPLDDLLAQMNADAGREVCNRCSNKNWTVYHSPDKCPKLSPLDEDFDHAFESEEADALMIEEGFQTRAEVAAINRLIAEFDKERATTSPPESGE